MFKKQIVIASSLLLSCISVLAQTSVNVNVNAGTTVRTVDERVFGVNSVMWDPKLGAAQTAQLVQQAGIRFIRLPGGSNSDITHWYSNIDIDTTTPFKWVSGFDAASGLIRSITPQAQAIVTVNYGSGSPEEAAAWVAYANFSTTATDVNIGTGTDPLNVDYDFKTSSYWANLRAALPLATDDGMNFLRLGLTPSLTQPMGFKYWEIGNEVYGNTWEYDKHSPANEPYTYATNAAAFITKMKAVDPTIKIGVVVETGQDSYGNGNTTNTGACVSPIQHSATNLSDNSVHCGWTPIVLARMKALGVMPDFLIYHRYDMGPGAESDSTLLQASGGTTGITSWASDATDLRNQITNYFGSGGNAIELLVTEHNSVYTNPGKQSTSLVNGLFIADSLGNILQTEFNSMNWWALRNGAPENGSTLLGNQSSSLYGWRLYGDYGMISTVDAITGVTSAYTPYPTYYAMKLASLFARGGDTVISASSNNNLLAVYGTTRATDSSMSLLVINKSPTASASATFNVLGFTPGASAIEYTYGIPNDNAANPFIGSGCSDITSSTLNSTGASFSTSFAPYSINVITFNRAAATLTTTAPTIVAQPASISATSGASASFTVGASGCPVPTYQWQHMASGASTWTNLSDDATYSGSGTATLMVTTAAGMSGDQFRAVATNSTSTANSNAATLTVSISSSSSSSSSVTVVGGGGGGGGGGGSLDWKLLAMLCLLAILGRKILQPENSIRSRAE